MIFFAYVCNIWHSYNWYEYIHMNLKLYIVSLYWCKWLSHHNFIRLRSARYNLCDRGILLLSEEFDLIDWTTRGQFAMKNRPWQPEKSSPLQFEKFQPWQLSWKLSAKYFMSADFWCFNCGGPPLCINHIFCQDFCWVWLFYTFSLSWLTRGNKSSERNTTLKFFGR